MKKKITFDKLRKLNVWAGLLHLSSLIAILVLSNDFTLPINAEYLSGPPGSDSYETLRVSDVNVAMMIAVFFGLSAFFHFLVSSPGFRKTYEKGLKKHINVFRWVEYSLSSTVMIVIIAQLNGLTSYAALLAIAGVNVSMILFGWLQERYVKPGSGDLLPFWFGSIAGIIPWIIIATQLFSPGSTTEATPPTFVYGIVFSLFALFNCFAIVQYLQYRAKGKWADYLYGERAYIILSFVAKSVLAWQIFGGTLAS